MLSGVILHELRWRQYLDQLIAFRQRMRAIYGLKLREEIHAGHMLNRPGPLLRIRKNDRLNIIRSFAQELAQMPDLNVINIVIDKQGKPADYDVFERAWEALLQRFENTLGRCNFSGPKNATDMGMVFPDNTDAIKLRALLRRMRRFNPVPNLMGMGARNLTVNYIIEDPNHRDSRDIYFVQAADLAAFLMYQSIAPNAYIRKKGGHNYQKILDPVMCKVISGRRDGTVRL